MKIEIHHHYHGSSLADLDCQLKTLTRMLEKIMMTQQELLKKVNEGNDRMAKIGEETTALLKQVEDLKVLIVNNPVTPEVEAAINKLATGIQNVDDLVPDAVP